jgi:hypothetical protein
VKITEGTKIVFGYGSCFDYMIELSEDLLNDRIYSDYKQVLLLIQSERPALARQLAVEIINCKFHWWPLRSYIADLTLAQMWERYYKKNIGIVRQHDVKKTCLAKHMESTLVITASWHEIKHALISVNSYVNVSSELMVEFVDSISDLNWWLLNGLRIWESIVQKVGGKVREVLFETKKEIKIDIFVLQFTEFVRFFNITIGESICIKIVIHKKTNKS